jgi:uncharacterized membrane protein YhaH (DUF805 family)
MHSTPTMSASQPGPALDVQLTSPEGGYGPINGWPWHPTQAPTPVLSAGRLTLVQTFFSPFGRIGRKSFWLASCVVFMFFLVGMLAAATISGEQVSSRLMAFVYLVSLYASSMVLAKRWHDRNHSGWMALVHFVPVLGPIWTLIECCTEGTRGANRYGVGTNPTPFG